MQCEARLEIIRAPRQTIGESARAWWRFLNGLETIADMEVEDRQYLNVTWNGQPSPLKLWDEVFAFWPETDGEIVTIGLSKGNSPESVQRAVSYGVKHKVWKPVPTE